MSEFPAKKVLTVAGFDPCGGAGILADMRVFQHSGLYGMAVITANTVQDEDMFYDVKWLEEESLRQLDVLLARYTFASVKIGLIPSLDYLEHILKRLQSAGQDGAVVWDPVLAAGSGYDFHHELKNEQLQRVLQQTTVVVPNLPEWEKLKVCGELDFSSLPGGCALYLKGGHAAGATATDRLFYHGQEYSYEAIRLEGPGKHGSGCTLSAALSAGLAQGWTLPEAAAQAHQLTQQLLASSPTRLGWFAGEAVS